MNPCNYGTIVQWNIYKITCTANGLIYIGVTIGSIEERLRQHIWASRGNCVNHLHKAIAKYGASKFKIELIERKRHWHRNAYKAFKRERYWMVKLNSIAPHGFNSTKLSSLELIGVNVA